jgi:hypothetical protein
MSQYAVKQINIFINKNVVFQRVTIILQLVHPFKLSTPCVLAVNYFSYFN